VSISFPPNRNPTSKVKPETERTVGSGATDLRKLYKGRARIEQAMGKLKRFKRIALRCEKTAQSYGALVACSIILAKSVHTA
jgi:transposase